MTLGSIEFAACERRKDYLREAERMRLIVALQQRNDQQSLQRIARWIGVQMVKWGVKLQGCKMAPACQCAGGPATEASSAPLQ
jgi:hypothetical protein